MRNYDGQTAEQRRDSRRTRLIAAGLELFGTQGYAATSVRAVLREAGLQERYFAESFTGLEGLLAAVHDDVHDRGYAFAVAEMARGESPEERLRLMVDAVARWLADDPRAARVKLVEVVGAGPLAERHRQLGMQAYAALIEAELPPLPPEMKMDPRQLSMALVAGVNGVLLDWLTGSLDISRDQLVDHALRSTLGPPPQH
ncbi:TetR/AcrR family transcriptional regulator [Streptomyces scopuliridis]|uniref:TetR/AcrR family transcriptional regulator n=1 Tax=Streptomyces scopuliridis TaxID=452529 RepID=UPI00343C5CED